MYQIEKKILDACLEKYEKDLAAVLIFGSYNTGTFIQGVSDIDTIILFKPTTMNLKKERAELLKTLSNIKIAVHHFRTLEDYEKHIYSKGSWSSWITVICGSKIVHSTPEFTEFKRQLQKNPLQKNKLINYIKRKDEFDLQEDLKKKTGWWITKAIFAHIRRKLQILNFYSGNNLEFDYFKCLKNLTNLGKKEKLEKLNKDYDERRALNEKEIRDYLRIAKQLTPRVVSSIKNPSREYISNKHKL
ncbi:MAG: nucleotidyltransferase domain-containing protein [Nanoarchaeota archaeon]